MRDLLLALLPPWDGDPVHTRNWSVAVALAIYGLIVVTVWSAGWMPSMFGGGYALASDVRAQITQQNQQLSTLQSAITAIQVDTLKTELLTYEVSRCRILQPVGKGKDVDLNLRQRALYDINTTIDAAMAKYYQYTHQVYQQQPCEVLMVGASQ